ncbi:MAG: hypothetical protein K0Q77_230 [Anaerosporomusa subterranea]|jgi:hypothetical protein|nr:hypothetical protein [Anaerosporomusa subterranea]
MRLQMAYVIACLTAGTSFLLNRALVKLIGAQTIITLSPVVEEMLKTLFPYAFDADIFVTHGVFGLIEAIYDWVQTRGRIAALLSIGGHGLFGLVTVLTAQAAGVYIGLAAGIVTHLLWNTIMVRFPLRSAE